MQVQLAMTLQCCSSAAFFIVHQNLSTWAFHQFSFNTKIFIVDDKSPVSPWNGWLHKVGMRSEQRQKDKSKQHYHNDSAKYQPTLDELGLPQWVPFLSQ